MSYRERFSAPSYLKLQAQRPNRAFVDTVPYPEKRLEASQTVLVHPDPPTARPPAEPTILVHSEAEESGPSTSIRTSISGQSPTERDNALVMMRPEVKCNMC